MNTVNSKQLLDNLVGITTRNLEIVRKKLVHLGDNQLKWTPKSENWSINEVLAHLNKYASYYHGVFKERIDLTKFKEPKENFTSSPLGRSAWKSMKLGNANNIKRKFRAPKSFNPRIDKEIMTGNEINLFIASQEELLNIINDSRNVNLRRVKVPISISHIIKFRLGDALQFVIYHNERHLQQVLNILGSSHFPKKQHE